jgi:hypothetical protein
MAVLIAWSLFMTNLAEVCRRRTDLPLEFVPSIFYTDFSALPQERGR